MALFVGILEFFATNVLFLFLYNCTFRTHSLQTLHTYLGYIPFFATVHCSSLRLIAPFTALFELYSTHFTLLLHTLYALPHSVRAGIQFFTLPTQHTH